MNKCDSMVANGGKNNETKIKATSADIIVHKILGTPYYEIKYLEIGGSEYHIGYGSYDLNNVFKWLKKCFEVVISVEPECELCAEMAEYIGYFDEYKGPFKYCPICGRKINDPKNKDLRGV